MHRYVLLLACSLIFQNSEAIVCIPSFCASINCVAVEKCDGPNQVIKPGGLCLCCDLCHTILSENEPCNNLPSVLRGSPEPLTQCGSGLICSEGKCKSFNSLKATAETQ